MPTEENGRIRFSLRVPEEWIVELDGLAEKRKWPRTTTVLHCIEYGAAVTEESAEPHRLDDDAETVNLSVTTGDEDTVNAVEEDAEAIDENFSPVARRYLRLGLGEETED